MTVIHHLLRFCRPALGLWVLTSPRVMAGFSSIYVFGDGVTNTNVQPSSGGAIYHETRFCNGRVFVEVLAGWQGVTFDPDKNTSYFGHDSSALIQSVEDLVTTPAEAANSLFIVWNNDADHVNEILENIDFPFGDLEPWNKLKVRSLADHHTAIEMLYGKGARKIVMPLAVNVMSVPQFNNTDPNDLLFARQRIIEYNAEFKTAMTSLMTDNPGLEIILPDTFTFFEQVLANPAPFGMINPSKEEGNAGGLDAGDPSLYGPGAQYVFWDDFHPTAKFQMHLAAFIQQIISPVQVSPLSFSGGSGQLSISNIPLGRAGVIEGSATLQAGSWVQDATINQPLGGNMTNTYPVPAIGPRRFYRAAFPVVWTWP